MTPELASMLQSVLVVEDESLVRMSIVLELEEAGLRVMEAANGEQARRLLEIDDLGALFTDVDLPGVTNGLELARIARQLRPFLPIVVTSGHLAVSQGELPTDSIFVSKPYRPEEIVTALCRSCSETRP